jgi:spore coat polysaccharide biosynthesis protein SpsF
MLQSVNTVLFLQARIHSTRLVGKALLPLADMTSLEMAMRSVYGCADQHILLCPHDCVDIFSPLAQRWGYEVVGGSEHDVLGRFVTGMQAYPSRWVIRATADNSIVGADLAKSLLYQCQQYDADYAVYTHTPHGSGVEVVKASTLLAIDHQCQDVSHREHVCTFISQQPEHFVVHTPMAPAQWQAPHLRTTLDTTDDYAYLQMVYQSLYRGQPIPLEDYISWSRHN